MKKNNSLIIAYIIFLFICAVTRLFGEFPWGQALVVAITTTSGIISFADLCYAVASEWYISSKETLDYAETAIYDIQGVIDAIEHLPPQSKGDTEDLPANISQEKMANYSRLKEAALDCKRYYEQSESGANENLHKSKLCEKAAIVLTIIGFTAFFVILAFEPITNIFINNQDFITILAFGVILFTQYLNEILPEKRELTQKSHNAVNEGWEFVRKWFESEVSHHAH